ncbi:hypothetical protein GCM10008908_02550 [Clostridium subterminale]|uniref:Uncharacterized protein n=1 Tax=Clostridium subterminale TaxID=1550 RepID=A0ABP3VUA8_CLOSU
MDRVWYKRRLDFCKSDCYVLLNIVISIKELTFIEKVVTLFSIQYILLLEVRTSSPSLI